MPAKPSKIKRKNNQTKPIQPQQAKPVPAPIKTAETSEKLLFYLNKLKNLFTNTNHPEPGNRENSAVKMDKLHREHYLRSSEQRTLGPPSRYTSSNPPRPREADNIQSEVYRVVNAAIDYGFANNVLEKKGDGFTFKRYHQKVPGQRYCERCATQSCYQLHNIAQGRVEKSYRGEGYSRPQERFVARCPRKIGTTFKYRSRK